MRAAGERAEGLAPVLDWLPREMVLAGLTLVPVYRGQPWRAELTRRWGLPNAAPAPGESPFGVCRLLFVDDDEDGKPVAFWVPEEAARG